VLCAVTLGLLCVSALVSGAETSFFSLSHKDIRRLQVVDHQNRRQQHVDIRQQVQHRLRRSGRARLQAAAENSQQAADSQGGSLFD